MNTEPLIVLTTCSSPEDRDRIIDTLLSERLAACVQVGQVRSHYVWRGERASEDECQLLIKTERRLYDRVEAAIKSVHSYETPEILAIPVAAGSPEYLSWLSEALTE